MGQRISRRECRQRQRCGDGLFQVPRIAKGTDETVVGLVVRRVGYDGVAKGLRRANEIASGEKVEAALGESFCVAFDGVGHGSL